MKKLEKLLGKLLEKLLEITGAKGMREGEVAQALIALIAMLVYEIFAIEIAIVIKCYLVLSLGTFSCIKLILECFINKIFFEKLDNYLLETPKVTTLLFWIIFIISMILSWDNFVGFIISTILAFILGDYRNNKENKNKE